MPNISHSDPTTLLPTSDGDFGSVDLYPADSDRGYVPYLATVAYHGALAAYPNGTSVGGCIIRGKLICSA